MLFLIGGLLILSCPTVAKICFFNSQGLCRGANGIMDGNAHGLPLYGVYGRVEHNLIFKFIHNGVDTLHGLKVDAKALLFLSITGLSIPRTTVLILFLTLVDTVHCSSCLAFILLVLWCIWFTGAVCCTSIYSVVGCRAKG
ncbi:hypothetical protein SLA2020_371300 [Shorea laevis]